MAKKLKLKKSKKRRVLNKKGFAKFAGILEKNFKTKDNRYNEITK